MALWTIGDLHLSFNSDHSMDQYGKIWVDHDKKLEKNIRRLVHEEDTLVLTGDHSQSNSLSSCRADLDFIERLPGRKILLRGNHDQFWDAKKTEKLNNLFNGRLYFLQNNFYTYGDYALVGTKGYCYEGKDTPEHAEMLVKRESDRLEKSFQKAVDAGYEKFIMFLHFPPTNIFEYESIFTKTAEKYGAAMVIYSHCHGAPRWDDSLKGAVNGVEYRLVSSDFLNFKPVKLLN